MPSFDIKSLKEGTVSVEKLASIYQIDEDDADIMLKWISKAIQMKKMLDIYS